jgi:hypothetical protein
MSEAREHCQHRSQSVEVLQQRSWNSREQVRDSYGLNIPLTQIRGGVYKLTTEPVRSGSLRNQAFRRRERKSASKAEFKTASTTTEKITVSE